MKSWTNTRGRDRHRWHEQIHYGGFHSLNNAGWPDEHKAEKNQTIAQIDLRIPAKGTDIKGRNISDWTALMAAAIGNENLDMINPLISVWTTNENWLKLRYNIA